MAARLAEQLEAARAEVARLEREVAAASCREVGRHDMVFMGGTNAGCGEDCSCSVPVHQCRKCGFYDYGDNEEAERVRAYCEEVKAA